MDPISYFTPGFNCNFVNGPFWISSLLEKVTEQKVSPFLTKLFLFDLLIANSHRDARSVRIYFTIDESGKLNKHFDYLIENNFGISYLNLNPPKAAPIGVDEIVSYIIENKTFKQAFEMIELMSLNEISNTIQDMPFLKEDEKIICLDIIKNQYEKIIEIKSKLSSHRYDRFRKKNFFASILRKFDIQ